MSKPDSSKKLEIVNDDERAALIVGLRSEESEKEYTLEESLEYARKRRKLWMKSDDLNP